MNLSNFPPGHDLYHNSRKGQLGLLKSQTGHVAIKEVICLAPKAYSILSADYTTLTNDKFSVQKQSFKCKHQDDRQYPLMFTYKRIKSVQDFFVVKS